MNAARTFDFEVYSGSGARTFFQVWDNQAFTAGVSRTFTAMWTVPPSFLMVSAARLRRAQERALAEGQPKEEGEE